MWRPSRLSQADKNQEIPGNIFACEAVNVEIAVVRRKRAISTGGDNTNEVWFPEKKNFWQIRDFAGIRKKKKNIADEQRSLTFLRGCHRTNREDLPRFSFC